MASATLAIASLAFACDPTVVIGSCSQPSESDAGTLEAGVSVEREPVSMPWSTGFEDGLCGYQSAGGYCYARHSANIEIVEPSSTRPGRFAAAFTVNANADASTLERSQARCVREGIMPKSAYYGAWYLIPELQTSDGNWNLFHFQGTAGSELHQLWDISLVTVDGKLKLAVYDFFTRTHPPMSGEAIPIGQWFHIVMRIVRSAQANGQVTVYQDDAVALDLTDVVTDDTDWGEWYVGNYGRTLVPPTSTVYVDDISIREDK